MTRAAEFDYRFGAALALSLVLHLGAMTLSPSLPKAPPFNQPVPLSVQLVQEPVRQVAELARPARPAATKPARAKPAPPKHEEAPLALTTPAQALPPLETIQAEPAIDEAPASPSEPLAPPPIAAPLQATPEPAALPAQRVPSAELLALYTKSLSEMFARYKEYPRVAELRGWEGSVMMRLRVAPSGRLIAAELYKSSGYDALDKQAMTMVTRAAVLPVPPEGLNAAEVPVLVPINFRLER
jgi:protein TonB